MTDLDLSSSENSGFAHVVEVTELTLTNHHGEKIDIRAVCTDANIESSIFEPGINGSLVMYDAHSMITRFPIIGEEVLNITYTTPGNVSKKGEYSIWKITDETPDDKGTSSTYRLHFCSPEFLQNAKFTIGKSYTNTDHCYSIVQNIQTEFLKSKKKLVIGKTPMKDPSKTIVIPLYKPFEAIDMILRRAYSGNISDSSYYLYFERADSWQLKMLEELISDPINSRLNIEKSSQELLKDVISGTLSDKLDDSATVYASTRFQDDSFSAKDIRRIISLRLNSRFDSLTKIREGLYDNESVLYSVYDKTVKGKAFNRAVSPNGIIDGTLQMNTQKFISDYDVPDSGFAGTQSPKTFYAMSEPDDKTDALRKIGGPYQSTRVAMSQVQISIVVPGDTAVDLGDVVNVIIPKFESVLDESEKDDFLQGKYLVCAVRDSILFPDKHVMTLDLYRDSYASPISNSVLLKEA
jgi:hypothetical protein